MTDRLLAPFTQCGGYVSSVSMSRLLPAIRLAVLSGLLVSLCMPAPASARMRLAASVFPSTPVTVGSRGQEPVGPGERPVMQPDPAQGAWADFYAAGGEELVRIRESGGITVEPLPLKLRGEDVTGFEFTPLSDGWGVATAHYWPGGSSEQIECSGIASPSKLRCSELVVAERSPAGRWTSVQALPHSSGRESDVTPPIEVNHHIELGWWESLSPPFRIAIEHPGQPFGPPHVIDALPEPRSVASVEDESLIVFHDRLFDRAKYSVGPKERAFVVLRPVYGDGRLGSPVVFRGPLASDAGVFEIGDGFEGANGSELMLVEADLHEGELYAFAVRRRQSRASSYEKPRLLIRHLKYNSFLPESDAQSLNHRTLLTLEQEIAHRAVLAGVEISPQGHPGQVRSIERLPPEREGQVFSWEGAISNTGSALVATSVNVSPEPIWLHPATPHCPAFARRTAIGYGDILGLTAGREGVFHVAWVDTQRHVQIASARVACSQP